MRSLQLIVLVLLCCPGILPAQELPRSSPESQGVSSEAILDFVTAADASIDTMHSFMLLRHGQVLTEGWWAPEAHDVPHVLWSLSKSFTSTAVGLAISEGKLQLDDSILQFFPEEAPENPSDYLKAMRVRDLLTMSTGHATEPKRTDEEPWVRTFLHHPVKYPPGTHFLYNTSATYLLSAIVQKVTGQTVLEYLRPKLFTPLGIANPQWASSPQGISIGGYGLSLCTEDIARFGQMLLQQGRWNGQQLVPQDWITLATTREVSNAHPPDPNSDWKQGYGFQFWRCRHNAYRGDGRDGQFCIVLPDQDAVVVMTARNRNMAAQLNLVWEKLLPGFHSAPLPENPAAAAALKSKLLSLQARPAPAESK
jgi:CubicO group peptidase (beta-lactamase class C family)